MDGFKQKIENELIALYKKDPVKIAQWFLVIMSRDLVAGNAAETIMKTSLDVGEKRYNVKCKIKIKEQ